MKRKLLSRENPMNSSVIRIRENKPVLNIVSRADNSVEAVCSESKNHRCSQFTYQTTLRSAFSIKVLPSLL